MALESLDGLLNPLPLIELSVPLKTAPTGAPGRVGFVVAGDHKSLPTLDGLVGLDTTFPPLGTCPPTGLRFNGGAIGTADAVQLLFWSAVWNTPALAPLAGSITAAVKSILGGPYMSGLRQYGVKRCFFGNAQVVVPSPPLAPNTFGESNVQGLIQSLIDQGTFPEPDEAGGRNLYFVMMPPNTIYGPGGARGAHSAFSTGSGIDPDLAWYAWIGNNTLSQMTSTFCHELVEMCTDPEPGSGWSIPGGPPTCSEIGDICNLQDAQLNGVTVESYWSVFDNACLIPTAWSLRRTLAGAGIKLNGKGLRSLQDPIASLNQFVVNL